MTAQGLSLPLAQTVNPAMVQSANAALSAPGSRFVAAPGTGQTGALPAGTDASFTAALLTSGSPGQAGTVNFLNPAQGIPELATVQAASANPARLFRALPAGAAPQISPENLRFEMKQTVPGGEADGENLPLIGNPLPPVQILPVTPPSTQGFAQVTNTGGEALSGIPTLPQPPDRTLILPGTDHPTDKPLPEKAPAADTLLNLSVRNAMQPGQTTPAADLDAGLQSERAAAFERSQIESASIGRDALARFAELAAKQGLDTRTDAQQAFARPGGADLLNGPAANSLVSPLTSYATGTLSSPAQNPAGAMQGLNVPLQPLANQGAWAKGLGNRMLTMSEDGIQTARIKLYPEHLGPLEVRIQLDQDVAKVWFGTNHGQTREALESALPRLKEMFQEQGMNLVQADVDPRQQHSQANGHTPGLPDWAFDDSLATVPAAATVVALSPPVDRLLDVVV